MTTGMNRRSFLSGGAASIAAFASADARLRTALMGFKPQWWKQFATSVIYVSNVANNGYGLGNDTTGNGTKAAPYLTPQKAQTVAPTTTPTAVEINPSGTSYVVDSGSGFFNVLATKSLTFGSDPSISAKPVLICNAGASAARVLFFNTSAKIYNFYNVVLDGTGTTGGNIVSQGNQTGGISFYYCNFRNSSGSCIATASGTSNLLSLFSNTFESTCHFIISGSGGNWAGITMSGNTFAQDNQVWHGGPAGTVTNFFCNGNTWVQNGVGTSTGLTFGGDTVGTLSFSSNAASGTFANALLNIPAPTIIGTVIAFSNNGGPSAGMILCNSENVTSMEVAFNNLINVSSDQIQLHNVGTVLLVHDNFITVTGAAQTHGISIGTDGFITDNQNVTATTTQNLGDLSTNTYVAQEFTMAVATASTKKSYLANILFTIKKQGSPTGNVVLTLYQNNAGAPGTVIEVSTSTISAASLPTTAAQWGAALPDHFKSTAGSQYWFSLHYTGAIDGTNYVVLSANVTVTGGSLSTSTAGSVWVNNPVNALIYGIQTGSFGSTTLNVWNNTVNVLAGSSTSTHGALIGDVNLGLYYNNLVFNSGIGHLFKNTFAISGQGYAYDNIATTSLGAQQTMYFKGSQGIKAYQNTLISTTATGGSVLTCSTDTGAGTNAPEATGEFKNNIVVCTAAAGTAYAVDQNSPVIITNNCVFSVGTINNLVGQTTWAGWQSAGYDANSVNANPNLPSAATSGSTSATDFIPPHTSPAGGIGANLQSIVPVDFGGAPFSTTPPAGAWNLAA